MKAKWFYLSFIFLGLTITSCYKTQDTVELDEYDITYTSYDTEFDFKTFKTFLVRDSVMIVSDYLTDEEIAEFYSDGTSDKIINKIVAKFESLGYTEVEDQANPDFMINPSILMSKQSGVIYNPYYWWGYPGYWGWYGGWYYKNTNYYYPPYWSWYPSWSTTYYSYETGTIVMEMADGISVRDYRQWLEDAGDNPDPNNAPPIEFRWIAQVDGILSSTADYNTNRAQRGFDEAFEQSPYLQK